MADEKRTKVLMVDDEVGFTNMMKLYLEKAGSFEVRVENAPQKAVLSAREFRPDIIFLDVIMPGMDGPDVLKQIKSEKALKDIPVVFLTAVVEQGQATIHDGVIGGHDFLPKPVSGEQIVNCIQEHLK